jgi:hypothetical protein
MKNLKYITFTLLVSSQVMFGGKGHIPDKSLYLRSCDIYLPNFDDYYHNLSNKCMQSANKVIKEAQTYYIDEKNLEARIELFKKHKFLSEELVNTLKVLDSTDPDIKTLQESINRASVGIRLIQAKRAHIKNLKPHEKFHYNTVMTVNLITSTYHKK